MRLIPSSSSASRQLLRLPLILSALVPLAQAGPYPRDDLHDAGYSYLMPRGCDSYCGENNWLCCGPGQSCKTLENNVATCVGGGGGGNYAARTTTWTETRTFTSTIMTHWELPPQPTAGVDCQPKADDQEPCGSICCAGWQTCAYKGQCSPKPGMEQPNTVVITQDGQLTTRYSAPFRVTGTTTVTNSGVRSTDATATATTTTDSDGASATHDGDSAESGGTGGGSKLSAGAIAGIVIGTLVGISLLMLLCFCCIARGLWHVIFGKKKEKEHREKVDIYDERYSSRHGSRIPSAYSRKERHSGWFGGAGGPSSVSDRREKKKSDGKKWLGIAGGAATLLALLNMKKDKRPARKSAPSRYSDSYYTYSDATSPSSSSSGGRTHHTRQTRDSRGTRYTRASRR